MKLPDLRKPIRSQTAGLTGRVAFEKADVQEIPYDDAFDAVVNLQMLHFVQDPVAMLDEMERMLAPDGVLFMADIRRSWVGLLDKVFKSALTVEEACALVLRSDLREGAFSSVLLWWGCEA
jgi:2-polyprenyl-3-methyl-5-hydroxy-6-metoxy-1,4-benzoquinol methylase